MDFGICHYLLDFLHIGEVAAEVGRKELRSIVAFQVAGLVTYPGIAGSVGLIEGVLGKLFPVLPDFIQHLLRVTVGHSSRHKLVLQGIQHIYKLLSHCLSQGVGLTLGKAGEFLGEKHHLLLINGDSVGVVEVFLHLRQVVLDRLYAQFPVNEIRDIIHRSRPVERIHRNEVLETLRMQLLEPFHHARRFELEHRGSIASAVEFVGRSIVYRYCLYVYFLSPTIADIVQTLVNDGKGVKAEEVHLEHSHTLDVMAVYLRSPDILVGFLIL